MTDNCQATGYLFPVEEDVETWCILAPDHHSQHFDPVWGYWDE